MTVGFFAPTDPSKTGVADYASHLLTALRAGGEVTLEPRQADVQLYHIGNNQEHLGIYQKALREPGVVVLHDAVLHHFLLGSLDRDAYLDEFVWNYGDWMRHTGEALWSARARSASDRRYFGYPMLRRICETARAVIVHNPAAAQMVLAHAPRARVVEIPHLLFPAPEPLEEKILERRKRLGVRPGELLCGVFGFLRESKRLKSVPSACRKAGVRLLIAGSAPPELERSMAANGYANFVIREPHREAEDFRLLLHSVDVCANLRDPSAGETSGIATTAMGAGKPVLMTASAENSRFPADCCVRIDAGLPEQAQVVAVLDWFRQFPSHARAIGVRAATWVRREHDPLRVAALYWNVLRSV